MLCELINTVSSSVRSCVEYTRLFVFWLSTCDRSRNAIEFFLLLCHISEVQVSKLDWKNKFSFCLQSKARIRVFSTCADSHTGFPFFCVALRHCVVGTGRHRTERWLQSVGHLSLNGFAQCPRRTDQSNADITPQIRSISLFSLCLLFHYYLPPWIKYSLRHIQNSCRHC